MPMVSYCRWILSARSSKSRTMEGFSSDMAELRPERTMAGHVRAMQSQSCRLARLTPLWFPRRQYNAPWKEVQIKHYGKLQRIIFSKHVKILIYCIFIYISYTYIVILWTAVEWRCCCLGWGTRERVESDLCSRNCRFPGLWTTHSELCCVPERWETSQFTSFIF